MSEVIAEYLADGYKMLEKSQKMAAYLGIITMLILIECAYVYANLMSNTIIGNRGTIIIPTITFRDYPTAYQSEIRGVFIHAYNTLYPNWTQITEVCDTYGINVIVIEALGNNFARYPSNIIPSTDYGLLPEGIIEAHKHGIKFYVSMNVLMSAYGGDGVDRRCVKSDGSEVNWMCPTKNASRELLKAIVQELFTKYPEIDGFMFDYIRYDSGDVCYCDECKARFIRDTGLTDVNWPLDVVEGGKYWKEFLEWRVKPVNELVQLIRKWILEVKPDCEFSAAVWSWLPEAPAYWRKWIGQDADYWVAQDWLDWVAPMIYTDNITSLKKFLTAFMDKMVAGPEGKIPIVPFIDTCVDSVSTPENFQQRVAKLRELGADGYIIWRYGGPGDGQGSGAPDIRPYLEGLNSESTFSIKNLAVSLSGAQATIAWSTDQSTSGMVEYSEYPLFNASIEFDPSADMNYWRVTYTAGTVLEANSTATIHVITIRNLKRGGTYYFRVKSNGPSGTVTTKVLNFTLIP